MSLPYPVPGLVVHYRFLWSHEYEDGLVEGQKPRPCAVVVAAGNGRVVMAPITHTPQDEQSAIRLTPAVCDLCS